MNKVEYGSFYKFLVSLGVYLFTIPFIVLNFTFNDNGILLINTKELVSLTDVARKVIENKQKLYSDCITYLPGFCVLLAFMGIILILVGSYFWFRMQKIADKKQVMENQELQQKLEDMTPLEIVNKVNDEVFEDEISSNKKDLPIVNVNDNKCDFNEDKSSNNKNRRKQLFADQMKEIFKSDADNKRKLLEYYDVEEKVANIIDEQYYEEYSIKRNVKVDDIYFDILATARDSKLPDLIFEIKYYNRLNSADRLNDHISKLYTLSQRYHLKTGRNVRGYLYIAIGNDNYKTIYDRIINDLNKYSELNIKVVLIKESSLD